MYQYNIEKKIKVATGGLHEVATDYEYEAAIATEK